MKEAFIEKQFRGSTWELIDACNGIIDEYQEAGYKLTLRQLYYQLVARAVLDENSMRAYNRVKTTLSDARLAGYVDWEAIEDRTRNLETFPSWASPAEIVGVAAKQYREDIWLNQPYHIEVWVEKEALAGVIAQACTKYRVGHLSCRGYMSQSEQYAAAQRFYEINQNQGKHCVVIHLGDHDPSGMDMTRDNQERLGLLSYHSDCVDVHRIALNMNQIDELQPPPNPAKFTDSRCEGYVAKYGYSSWELDALEPTYLNRIINEKIETFIDSDAMQEALEQEKHNRAILKDVVDNLKL